MKIWSKLKTNFKFSEVDPYKNFCNNIWKNKVKKDIILNFKKLNSNKIIKNNYFISCSPLPFLLIGLKKKIINICDFGSGGMELYFQVSSLNINKLILIDAVEVPLIVDLYKNVKKKYLKDTKKTKICFLQNYNEKKSTKLFT
jgi:hypothetical protein